MRAAALAVALWRWAWRCPVLSLAWGNESAARRNEQKLRILAMQKADEAQELQKVAVQQSEIARRERAAHSPARRKPTKRETAQRRPSSFWSRRFASPTPPSTVVRSRSSTCSIERCEKSTNHFAINL